MASIRAATVADYLAELPEDRRAVVSLVRDAVNAAMPPGYEEGMVYGMIGWSVPLSHHPDTHNGQPLGYVALAAQKHHYALYLMAAYADSAQEQRLRQAYGEAGIRLDLGKCCLRFRSLDGLLIEPVSALIASMSVEAFVAAHAAARAR